MTTGLTELLASTLSQDFGIRENAEKNLASLCAHSFPQYTVTLCQELSNEQNMPAVRQASGILFKNAISAKDMVVREQYAQRWMQLDASFRAEIKKLLLQTLGTPVALAGSASAACIHAIAEIELPQELWPDLIEVLCANVQSAGGPSVKENSLIALGYICETVDARVLEVKNNANLILTAIACGARREEPNQKVRYAAIRALINSLEFVRNNFENEHERNYIMQIVCEATQSTDDELVISAFECLVKIMYLYYDYMLFYMKQALIALTMEGMKSQNEKVAMQSLEFWSTVCEEEAFRVQDSGGYPSQDFARSVCKQLVDVLVYLLTKKDENDDEDEYNVPMSAATCLSYLAGAVSNDILSLIVPWITKHLMEDDWHYREAAVMAFGSILDGITPDALRALVQMVFQSLIKIMKEDSNEMVKDTTSWALGRVCEKMDGVEMGTNLTPLIEVLVGGLNDQPKIAANCAWSIMHLGEYSAKDTYPAEPYSLLPYFDILISSLLKSAEGKLSQEGNVKATSYEAIATLVLYCVPDCYPTVIRLLTEIMAKLQGTVLMQNEVVNNDDRMLLQEQQANLCGVLTNIIRCLKGEMHQFSDQIMRILLQILSTASKSSTVHEDVFMVVGALSGAVDQFFSRYMEEFKPFLLLALQNPQDSQLSNVAVGLVGDICRALNGDVAPYCNDFMALLVENLQSDVLDRSVKPAILSCFGDIAMAIGGHFQQYMTLMPFLKNAMEYATQIREGISAEEFDYFNILRESILEAYIGIIQGLSSANSVGLLQEHIEAVFLFMRKIQHERETVPDREAPESLMNNMIGLIGDIAEAFPPRTFPQYFSDPWVENLLKELKQIPNSKSADLAKWAKSRLRVVYVMDTINDFPPLSWCCKSPIFQYLQPMGFVTVLVQHAWAMQPAGSEEQEYSAEQKPSQNGVTMSNIRVSVPSSIHSFVKAYNSGSRKNHERFETMAADIMARLENMVFSSIISDPSRKDNVRLSIAIANRNKEKQDEEKNVDKSPSSKTKRYCAQARRSLLALSRIKSQEIRDRCLELLLEALDTNELASDDAEVANLLLFVNEIADVLEMAIIQRRRRKRQGKGLNEKTHYVTIDDYIERLLLCTALSIQRLEFACEVKAFYIPQEVHSSFEHLLDVQLPCLTSDDPYLQQLICSTSETIRWLTSTRVEAEELMASPVALSLLSQITRMAPPNNILSLGDPFFGILTDLKEKNEWYLGRKFIRLLATSALLNADACSLFLSLMKRLDKASWQWTYLGILSTGVIVLTSPFASVRKLALEQGLLEFILRKGDESEEDEFWRIRSAAALVLHEVYCHRKSDPLAILVLENLKEQNRIETHPLVKRQLANAPTRALLHGRLFFLFKYVCIALAESYSASQSRYIFLRKYLKTTDRKVESAPKKINPHHVKKNVTSSRRAGTKRPYRQKNFWDERPHDDDPLHFTSNGGDGEENTELHTDLSENPYHYNYKKGADVVRQGDSNEENAMEEVANARLGLNFKAQSISRYHAVLQCRQDDRVFIYDLQSTHKTFLNKKPLVPRKYTEVRSGDILRFGGSTRLYVCCSNVQVAEIPHASPKPVQYPAVSWGFAEDAMEEEEGVQDDDFYLNDPKKALQDWMDDNHKEMAFEYKEEGRGAMKCHVASLSITTEYYNLVCEGRGARKKEAERESQKKRKRKGDLKPITENFDSLLEKFESTKLKIDGLKKELIVSSAEEDKLSSGIAEEDDLDSYVRSLDAQAKRVSREKIFLHISELQKELARFLKLLTLCDPEKASKLSVSIASNAEISMAPKEIKPIEKNGELSRAEGSQILAKRMNPFDEEDEPTAPTDPKPSLGEVSTKKGPEPFAPAKKRVFSAMTKQSAEQQMEIEKEDVVDAVVSKDINESDLAKNAARYGY
ncbi:karyopherin beta [Dinochytrium kinnereticum]|nr:karyopherin beta [Dinochytrium kinnereticum]